MVIYLVMLTFSKVDLKFERDLLNDKVVLMIGPKYSLHRDWICLE
jgi:hypothetical protein